MRLLKKTKNNKVQKEPKKMDWDTMINKLHEVFQDINESAKSIEESLKKIKHNNPNVGVPK